MTLSKGEQEKLKEAEGFYKDRIQGWMLTDLERSIEAKTNFLTALGCLVYTEIIGIFLPPLVKEKGSLEERRFYRCLLRLPSKDYLLQLDEFLVTESRKGVYGHLRHNMTHKYFPVVSKREGGVVLFFPSSVVARDGFAVDKISGEKKKSPPIFRNDEGGIVIANRNYVDELKRAVQEFIRLTFKEQVPEYQRSAIAGADVVFRGK